MAKKRGNKWIDGLTPETPVSRAAKKTLRRRLQSVWELLQDAAKRADESPEYVHQMRVASRRAMAAVQGYAELLPRKKATWISKQLHRIRRRGGEARDFDVMIERLGKRDDAKHMKPLFEKIESLRAGAQEPIERIYRKLRRHDFPRRFKRMLKKTNVPDDACTTTFAAWARVGLSRTVAAFFNAAAGDLSDINALHQFRIEGKQLRYAIEYFAGAFGPELREELYAEIEHVQEFLGNVNDHASAVEHLSQWKSEWDDPLVASLLEQLVAEEQAALAKARDEFFRWWTPGRAADLKQRFDDLLHLPGRGEVA